ncbi:HEPN domain-containing protein [Methanocaldococcus indicus]|uniref:HEPN domain-containing protein n=1 Tax=Methanocaldococcus indicus TaxID=213231 RepID=UPI003C6DB1BB
MKILLNKDTKEEIQALMEIAEENLSASKILFENKLYRDAIARAYYAIFHSAKALLLTKNINPKKHAGVIKMFGL